MAGLGDKYRASLAGARKMLKDEPEADDNAAEEAQESPPRVGIGTNLGKYLHAKKGRLGSVNAAPPPPKTAEDEEADRAANERNANRASMIGVRA